CSPLYSRWASRGLVKKLRSPLRSWLWRLLVGLLSRRLWDIFTIRQEVFKLLTSYPYYVFFSSCILVSEDIKSQLKIGRYVKIRFSSAFLAIRSPERCVDW